MTKRKKKGHKLDMKRVREHEAGGWHRRDRMAEILEKLSCLQRDSSTDSSAGNSSSSSSNVSVNASASASVSGTDSEDNGEEISTPRDASPTPVPSEVWMSSKKTSPQSVGSSPIRRAKKKRRLDFDSDNDGKMQSPTKASDSTMQMHPYCEHEGKHSLHMRKRLYTESDAALETAMAFLLQPRFRGYVWLAHYSAR